MHRSSFADHGHRAYIAASRRRDRSIEARLESARRASELHQERTGKRFKITEKIVIEEEMYEEEDPKYDQMRLHMAKANAWIGDSPFGYQSSQDSNSLMNPLHIFPFQPSTPMDSPRSRLHIQTQVNPQIGFEPQSSLYAQSPSSSVKITPTSLATMSPNAINAPQIHSKAIAQMQTMTQMSETSMTNLSQPQLWDVNYFNLHNQITLPQHSQTYAAAKQKEISIKQQGQPIEPQAEDVSGTYFGFQIPSERLGEKFHGVDTPDGGSNLTVQTPVDHDMQAGLDAAIPEMKTNLLSQDMTLQMVS